METTDQNMHHVESSEDMGPLLMHDPDEEEGHSLSSSDQHTLLSDVHLPGGSTFITADVDKSDQLDSIDHSISIEKDESSVLKESGSGEATPHEQAAALKFYDGQPVTLEDGSTAYVLSSFKEGSQPVVFEDGTTMYISHEPPNSKFDHTGIDNSSLNLLHDLPSINEAEEKRLTAAAAAMSAGDQKLYKCENDGCKKVYTTYHHLQYHRRSHLERKPFVCGYSGCNKTFSTSYGLKSHIRVHTGEKPYKCPHICTKAFKTSGDLQKHIRIHTGEKPFRCPFQDCERSFTTSNIRKVHIRTHTGEKPYICEECGKRFSSCTNHRNHIRIHSGERPYVCQHEGCDKRFTEYSSLYKHNVVHSTSKPYTCTQCGKLYRQASTLAMHKRTAHGETEVMIAEADIMGGQLITLEQSKGTILSSEVVGLMNAQSKQFANSRMVSSSQQMLAVPRNSGKKIEDQQMDLSHIDPDNLVIVTHPCFKVMQSEGAAGSESIGTQMMYSACLREQEDTTEKSGSEIIAVTQNIDLSSADIITDSVS